MPVETLTTISPVTNKPILIRQGLSAEAIRALPTTAQEAFRSYRKSHPTLSSRQAIVTKALQLLSDQQNELGKELTEQMGRPIAYTAKEIATAVKRGQYLNRIAGEVLEKDTPGDEEQGFKRYIRREPVGVVLVIFAWNYPYLILVNSLIPALLAGNSVILKPSPQTPTIVEHIASIFSAAGLPKNVIQFLHCGAPSDLTPLLISPSVNHICFTGSVAVGLTIQQLAARRIVNVGLELGGNDPAYIRADADPKWAAEEIVDGAIFNSGQSCCAIERVYVAEAIYEPFISALKDVLSGYKAIAAGAVNETPPNTTFTNFPPEGNYVAPTLLTNVTHSMAVMRDETFGPVIPVMKVSSDAEAIALMNDSEFGLTASIWTADVTKGEELSQQVEAGTVFVNRADFPSPDLAWTGWKNSGRGVTLSRFGFEQFVKLKSVHLKDYPK